MFALQCNVLLFATCKVHDFFVIGSSLQNLQARGYIMMKGVPHCVCYTAHGEDRSIRFRIYPLSSQFEV